MGEIAKTGTNRLEIPIDLAALPDGNLAVVEWGEKTTVRVLSRDGRVLCELTPHPPLPQEWSRPRAVCAGSDGSVFVLDNRFGCVRWYDPGLNQRLTFGRGVLSDPECLVAHKGKLYVSNSGKGEVLEFNLAVLDSEAEWLGATIH
jgi:hypothetical protein